MCSPSPSSSLTYVIGHQIGAHPIAFILYAMLVSALVLLAATGPGPDAMRIILAPQSWLVGVGTIGMEIFYYLLLRTSRRPTAACWCALPSRCRW